MEEDGSWLKRYVSVDPVHKPAEFMQSLRFCHITLSVVVFIYFYIVCQQIVKIDKDIDESLEAGLIHPVTSPLKAVFFLIIKKHQRLHPCIDCQGLKVIMVRNRYLSITLACDPALKSLLFKTLCFSQALTDHPRVYANKTMLFSSVIQYYSIVSSFCFVSLFPFACSFHSLVPPSV